MLNNLPRQQQGVVMLVFLLLIVITGATLFLSVSNTRALEVRERDETGYQLNQAKQALLAYGFNYLDFENRGDNDTSRIDEGPGRLPCPDTNNNGRANADCNTGDRGRLPQVGAIDANSTDYFFSDYNDGLDQQFWYVIDDKFSENTENPLNTLDTGTLTIDGQGSYVAVIIAPGPALTGQNRPVDPTLVNNYLESDNISGTNFVNANPANPDGFNDRVIGITTDEMKTMMALKVAQEIEVFVGLLSFPIATTMYLVLDILSTSPFYFSYGMQWYAEDDWNLVTTYSPLTILPLAPTSTIRFAGCDIIFTYQTTGGFERDRPSC